MPRMNRAREVVYLPSDKLMEINECIREKLLLFTEHARGFSLHMTKYSKRGIMMTYISASASATEIAYIPQDKSASVRPIFPIFPIIFLFRFKANDNIIHSSLTSLELHHVGKEAVPGVKCYN